MTPPRYTGGCLVLRDELYPPAVWTEPEDDYDRCSQCGAETPDVVGLVVMDVAPGMEAEDFGFCSVACFVLHVRERYIECGLVLATPAEAPGPPSGRVSAGIGGAQGRSPGSAAVQASPTSEAGA